MLLKCWLLHRDIVLPRHAILSTFVSLSTPWSIYFLFMWYILPLWPLFSLQLTIESQRYRQTSFLNMFVKSSASGCCLGFAYFFPNFSLAVLIKVLLVKEKHVYRKAVQKLLRNSHMNFFSKDYKKSCHNVKEKPIQFRLKYLFIILHNPY